MGASVSRSDFVWSEDNEPHAARRKEILSKFCSNFIFCSYPCNFMNIRKEGINLKLLTFLLYKLTRMTERR